jgi:hypothetical protein
MIKRLREDGLRYDRIAAKLVREAEAAGRVR